ncbi:MAG: hypothetical protein AB4290_23315 [Spirulina sp.]
MQLSPEHIAKIDPFMEEALMQATGEDTMLAILNLEMNQPLVKEPFQPKEFPSYQDYRRALINYRKKEFSQALEETLKAIQNLSLQIMTGGTTSQTVVVRGTVKQVLKALELPGVRQGTIDRAIALPDVAPQDAIERIAELYI